MDLQNKNIVNLFNPAEVNNKSLLLFMYSFVPAAFVAKTIESALVYLLLAFVYIVLVFVTSLLINKTVREDLKFVVIPLIFIGLAVLVSQLAGAFFINFTREYILYIYLLAVSAIPYMLVNDNKDKTFGNGLTNTLQTFIGFAVVLIVIAFVRELLGTGMITFGSYTSISFSINVFSKYAITVLQNPFGTLIILGFIMALVNRKVVASWWHI